MLTAELYCDWLKADLKLQMKEEALSLRKLSSEIIAVSQKCICELKKVLIPLWNMRCSEHAG